ncbi:KdsC family phosphatase [Pleomorphovibrio marinus]|uniref:KdsC family phosphatase n=1 Tax=Pleomorphovibrio marinus TaxID=2164132 RepID=UPI001E4048E8|nr:HAD hydrolase family protein [Pleomorphovibrio marinus]
MNNLIHQKANLVKAVITDIDGVLTDGGIILDDQGMEYKRFQVKDGQIIRYLKRSLILTVAISGRDVSVSKKRCEQMGFNFHFHGVRDKLARIKDWIAQQGLSMKECAYIGDDLIDLELLSQVGFSAAPSDALSYVKENVDYTTVAKGGEGAFRELADLILSAKGILPGLVNEIKNGQLKEG